MSDTASIRLPRTGSIGARPIASRARAESARRAARVARSPRAAYAAGTYVVVDEAYAQRPSGTYTGVPTGDRVDGTFVSADAELGARPAGSYVD